MEERKMKKVISLLAVSLLVLTSLFVMSGCKEDGLFYKVDTVFTQAGEVFEDLSALFSSHNKDIQRNPKNENNKEEQTKPPASKESAE